MKRFFRRKPSLDANAPANFGDDPAIQYLWMSTSLSRDHFDTAYLPLLQAVLTNDRSAAERSRMIQLIHGLFVMRNGIVLGKGVPIEEVSLMGNAFTLALVSAPLLDHVAQRQCAANGVADTAGYSLAMASTLMGDTAFAWLTRHAVVFNDWIAYFMAPEQSEIRQAITAFTERNPQLSGCPIALADGKRDEPERREPEEHVLPLALQYLSWLRHAIEAGAVTVNAPDAAIHITENAEVFLRDPNAWHVFAELTGKKPVTIRRRLASQHYLKSSTQGKGHDIFYTLGQQVMKGVVLTRADILFGDAVPPASQYIARQQPRQAALFEERTARIPRRATKEESDNRT